MKEKPAAKRGAAPAPTDETLEETVLVRLTPTEKALYSELAKQDGRSLSSWVRRACAEKAKAETAKD